MRRRDANRVRRAERQAEALERQSAYKQLSPQARIALVKKRPGAASRERHKLGLTK